jgi:hypothetical protein
VAITPPTTDELNIYIRARLALIGIDISVLPVSDSNAPADQTRVLSSCRQILTGTVPTISNYLPDVQENPPVLYPAPFTEWASEDGGRKSLRDRRKELGLG